MNALPAASPTQEDIIAKLAATSLSVVFSAPPGCGKTTTELAWLARVFDLYPDAIVRVVAVKNDAFLGLREAGCVTFLDLVDFTPLKAAVDWAFNILNSRRALPEERRHEYDVQPVWLVLGDWFSVSSTLITNKRYAQLWADIAPKIWAIITVGRAFLVGICADTQSFSTRALGMPNDANIRDCLNLCALGKISRNEDGQEQGGYGAIAKAVGNERIVDNDSLRRVLLQELEQLQVISDSSGCPVFFTTMGQPRMMLLPDLRFYEQYRLSNAVMQRLSLGVGNSPPPASHPQKKAVDEEDTADAGECNLTASAALGEPLRTIWRFAKEQGDWVSVRDIARRNFAVLKDMNANNVDQIRQYLVILASQDYGEINEAVASSSAVAFRAF